MGKRLSPLIMGFMIKLQNHKNRVLHQLLVKLKVNCRRKKKFYQKNMKEKMLKKVKRKKIKEKMKSKEKRSSWIKKVIKSQNHLKSKKKRKMIRKQRRKKFHEKKKYLRVKLNLKQNMLSLRLLL